MASVGEIDSIEQTGCRRRRWPSRWPRRLKRPQLLAKAGYECIVHILQVFSDRDANSGDRGWCGCVRSDL